MNFKHIYFSLIHSHRNFMDPSFLILSRRVRRRWALWFPTTGSTISVFRKRTTQNEWTGRAAHTKKKEEEKKIKGSGAWSSPIIATTTVIISAITIITATVITVGSLSWSRPPFYFRFFFIRCERARKSPQRDKKLSRRRRRRRWWRRRNRGRRRNDWWLHHREIRRVSGPAVSTYIGGSMSRRRNSVKPGKSSSQIGDVEGEIPESLDPLFYGHFSEELI